MTQTLPWTPANTLTFGRYDAQTLAVLLHGIGQTPEDLRTWGESWADTLPARVIIPTGFAPFDRRPSYGYQWYSLEGLTLETRRARAKHALSLLQPWLIKLLKDHDRTPEQLVLAGFSQGGIISLSFLEAELQPAVIISVAGFYPSNDPPETNTAHKPPILLLHGDRDRVLAAERSAKSYALLADAGYPCQLHILEGEEHAVSEGAMRLGAHFCVRNLAR